MKLKHSAIQILLDRAMSGEPAVKLILDLGQNLTYIFECAQSKDVMMRRKAFIAIHQLSQHGI